MRAAGSGGATASLCMRETVFLLNALTMLPVVCGALFRLALPRAELPDPWGPAAASALVQVNDAVVKRGVLALGFVYHCAFLCVSCMEWSMSRSSASARSLSGGVVRCRSWLLMSHVCVHAYSRGQLAASMPRGSPAAAARACDTCCELREPMLLASYGLAFVWLALGRLEQGWLAILAWRGAAWALGSLCFVAIFWLGLRELLPACAGGEAVSLAPALALDTLGICALGAGVQFLFRLERPRAALALVCD
jgi:hypothetical protein